MIVKFRGINKRGDVVFGAGVQTTEYDYDILLQNPKECELIQKNTAAQFVGYDKNDKEVYSDDKLISETGHEILAHQIIYNDIGSKFNLFSVKEN